MTNEFLPPCPRRRGDEVGAHEFRPITEKTIYCRKCGASVYIAGPQTNETTDLPAAE